MFSFTQLCEYYVSNGHSWFYFSKRLLDYVDKQERGDIEIEPIDESTVRIFVEFDEPDFPMIYSQPRESKDSTIN